MNFFQTKQNKILLNSSASATAGCLIAAFHLDRTKAAVIILFDLLIIFNFLGHSSYFISCFYAQSLQNLDTSNLNSPDICAEKLRCIGNHFQIESRLESKSY